MRRGPWTRRSSAAALLAPLAPLAPLALLAPVTLPAPFGCGQPSEAADRSEERDALALNRRCTSCHVEIAGEWARSQHHGSADAVFQKALSREPLRFCEGCHAPEAPTSAAAAGALGELGVACVTCHAVSEGAPAIAGDRLPERHPAVSVATGSEACRSCHEFEFPGSRVRPELFQSTITEHQASSYAGSGCTGCHMPAVQGRGSPHASHAFAASRDVAAQKGAVRVVAERASATSIKLTLTSRGVGHAHPTGDLFRRIAVRVEARGADYAVVARGERFLARHFEDVVTAPRTIERRVVADDRLFPGEPRELIIELGPDARGRELGYEVRFERVLHMNPRFEAAAQVESSVLLASGSLPAKLPADIELEEPP